MNETIISWTDVSWNPWSGCSKVSPGCAHCLAPETPILYADMKWRPISEARVGDVLLGFDEFAEPGRTRKVRSSVIEAVWCSRQETRRLITGQSDIITTGNHRWLRSRSHNWPTTDRLRAGKSLRQIGVTPSLPETDQYKIGYLAGMTLGDGTFRFTPGQRSDKKGYPQAYWRVALIDTEPIGRLVSYLAHFNIEAYARPFHGGAGSIQPLQKVEIRALGRLAALNQLLSNTDESLEYVRGFLAGFFDAEGQNGNSLRITQKDTAVLNRIIGYGSKLGFNFQLERFANRHADTIRLQGPQRERIRFFSTCQPAIARKRLDIFGRTLYAESDPVVTVERGRDCDVVDIQTSTHTFFAGGLATHNCYAETLSENKRGTRAFPNGFDLTYRWHKLNEPLKVKEPKKIFVNSMSDLYFEQVPLDNILRVFDVMNECHERGLGHQFQILTKRSQRLLELAPRLNFTPNIWQGVSVENQRWTSRIDDLVQVPAHIRFVSVEPMLGPIDLRPWLDKLHWIIVGGESGADYRPLNQSWVRSIRDQCQAANVAFFFKQDAAFRTETRTYVVEEDGRQMKYMQFPGEMLQPIEVTQPRRLPVLSNTAA